MTLTIYGDFNCPFSALASARADVLLARGGHDIEWRAIQHDKAIPPGGQPTEDETALEFAAEIATVLELSEPDLRLHLSVPSVRSNTALACAAFAAAGYDAHRLRRRLFAAVWSEGRNLGERSELRRVGADGQDVEVARAWQGDFDAMPRPITPTVVLPDGYVSRGLGALSRLADLTTAADQMTDKEHQ